MTEKPREDGDGAHDRPQVVPLGPVVDLEAHVPADWWRRIFDSLYLRTDGDVVDDDRITRQEVDLFLHLLNLRPSDRVLDLCCGHGRHSLELARRGYQAVEGLDRSHYLIQRARNRAKREGLSVRFREGDARRLPHPADNFDAVLILGNSFGYFETPEEDLQVLREVQRVLKPGGRVLIDVTDGDYLRQSFQPRGWEWLGRHQFVCRERSLSAKRDRLISRELVIDIRKGVVADRFYAERLYNADDLRRLLHRAGFVEVQVHGSLTPDSQRNQDLGMMARRLVITARIPLDRPPRGAKQAIRPRHVTVLLGDPRKPDKLKPGAVFDEDDQESVQRLKEALESLNAYTFDFLDHHDTLLHELRQRRGTIDLVFNLCDEGFSNDPRKELHIPALLEMLDLPYTGAGPQCLAYCYDKSLVRGVAKEMGVPVPPAVFLEREGSEIELPFEFPVIIKPNFGDSSFGITQRSVAYSPEALLEAVAEVRGQFGYDKPILVEKFLTGKDLTVGIIGNPPEDYQVLPITEEDYSVLPAGLPRLCGYEAKWLPDSPYWQLRSIPAELPEATRSQIVEACVRLFQRLECRDYARFDWRLDEEGQPYLLEVNPNPGWVWDGHLAKVAALAGITYPDMLAAILEAAGRRLTR